MALGKKNTNITMDSGLPTGSGGGTRYSKHLSERSNRNEPSWLNLTKKLEITVHQVKIQISSRIDLQLFCQVNNSESRLSQIRRVHQTERVARFDDEVISIDLSKIKGRLRNQSVNNSQINISHSNLSSDVSSFQCDAADQRRDEVVCYLKLFAVREKDQKLIGMVNFTVDW